MPPIRTPILQQSPSETSAAPRIAPTSAGTRVTPYTLSRPVIPYSHGSGPVPPPELWPVRPDQETLRRQPHPIDPSRTSEWQVHQTTFNKTHPGYQARPDNQGNQVRPPAPLHYPAARPPLEAGALLQQSTSSHDANGVQGPPFSRNINIGPTDGRPAGQPMGPPISQATGQHVGRPIPQPTGQSIRPNMAPPLGQPISHNVGDSRPPTRPNMANSGAVRPKPMAQPTSTPHQAALVTPRTPLAGISQPNRTVVAESVTVVTNSIVDHSSNTRRERTYEIRKLMERTPDGFTRVMRISQTPLQIGRATPGGRGATPATPANPDGTPNRVAKTPLSIDVRTTPWESRYPLERPGTIHSRPGPGEGRLVMDDSDSDVDMGPESDDEDGPQDQDQDKDHDMDKDQSKDKEQGDDQDQDRDQDMDKDQDHDHDHHMDEDQEQDQGHGQDSPTGIETTPALDSDHVHVHVPEMAPPTPRGYQRSPSRKPVARIILISQPPARPLSISPKTVPVSIPVAQPANQASIASRESVATTGPGPVSRPNARTISLLNPVVDGETAPRSTATNAPIDLPVVQRFWRASDAPVTQQAAQGPVTPPGQVRRAPVQVANPPRPPQNVPGQAVPAPAAPTQVFSAHIAPAQAAASRPVGPQVDPAQAFSGQARFVRRDPGSGPEDYYALRTDAVGQMEHLHANLEIENYLDPHCAKWIFYLCDRLLPRIITSREAISCQRLMSQFSASIWQLTSAALLAGRPGHPEAMNYIKQLCTRAFLLFGRTDAFPHRLVEVMILLRRYGYRAEGEL